MPEPFSIALGIISVFKDTYLVGKFIYKTVSSGTNNETERKQIAYDFRRELLLLRSFGKWFVNSKGLITRDSELDELWLTDIADTLQRLKENFEEYRVLAQENDANYKKFSPSLNESTRSTDVIEFDVKEEIPLPTQPGFLSKFKPSKKLKDTQLYIASDWALFRRKKLERVLAKFQKRNQRLQDILPFAISAHLQASHQKEAIIKNILQDEDAKLLGLSGHVQIRGLIQGQSDSGLQLSLGNAIVESQFEHDAVHVGTVKTTMARGNVTSENVLIEYKYYARKDDENSQGEDQKPEIQEPRNAEKVTQLAGLLHSSGSSSLGTLPLKGFVDQSEKGRHAFVFYFPEKTARAAPTSLHFLISQNSQRPWSLARRFKIAQHLAKTIGSFHIDRWVHKNISSKSLVFFEDRESHDLRFDYPYLVNFEYSRPESGSTLLLRDNDEGKNVYRHPSIQDIARPSFTRLHDIYSLGVVLLEIAIWDTAENIVQSSIREGKRRSPEGTQKLYIKQAADKIPWLMGTAYSKAVLACLDSEFADQFSRPEFPETFRKEVVDNLSAKCLSD